MREWEVWSEGYACTGDISGAHYHGKTSAITFRDACITILGEDDRFDKESLKLWGCRIYDNEHNARQSFG